MAATGVTCAAPVVAGATTSVTCANGVAGLGDQLMQTRLGQLALQLPLDWGDLRGQVIGSFGDLSSLLASSIGALLKNSLLILLNVLGLSITPILTALGVGGLAVALAECCFGEGKNMGAKIELPACATRADDLLFNEAPSRIVVSVPSRKAGAFEAACQAAGAPILKIGAVAGSMLSVKVGDRQVLSARTGGLRDAWFNSISEQVEEG